MDNVRAIKTRCDIQSEYEEDDMDEEMAHRKLLKVTGVDPVIIKVNPSNPLVITMSGDKYHIEFISSKGILGTILSTAVHGVTSVVTALINDGADLSVLAMVPSTLLKISVVAVVSKPPLVVFTN